MSKKFLFNYVFISRQQVVTDAKFIQMESWECIPSNAHLKANVLYTVLQVANRRSNWNVGEAFNLAATKNVFTHRGDSSFLHISSQAAISAWCIYFSFIIFIVIIILIIIIIITIIFG